MDPEKKESTTTEIDELSTHLIGLGVDTTIIAKIKEELGATSVADLSLLTEANLIEIGMKSIPAKRLLGAITPPQPTAAAPVQPSQLMSVPRTMSAGTYTIPEAAKGTELLSSLSTTRVLKVDDTTVRVALEALFADSHNLSKIPEALAEAMDTFANTIEDPVDDRFDEIYELVRSRKYAEVGVDKRFATEAMKRDVITKLRKLPEVVYAFHSVLSTWHEDLKQNRAAQPFAYGDPGLYPNFDMVLAAAEGVVACLRKTFAGFGGKTVKAMAFESLKIRESLEIPDLPVNTGAANREIMLRNIGCDITDADTRIEAAIAKYVIFVATIRTKLPVGQEGPALDALYSVGQGILPWMQRSSVSDPINQPQRPTGRNYDPPRSGGRVQ